MPNQEFHGDIYELISAYLSGNASGMEVEQLEDWVSSSEANKHTFIEMKKAWLLAGITHTDTSVDVEKAWQQTSTEIFDEPKVIELNPLSNRRRWLTLAASVLFLAVASFLLYQNTGTTGAVHFASTDQSQNFDLNDGSQIVLNQASTLDFELDEDNMQRKATLTGDAFFDVARNEAMPFVISTDHVNIEVLGTSFYVDARPDQDEVQVIVESGKVAVRVGDEQAIIKANEKVVFNKKSRRLVKQENEDPNFNALKTKTLVFNNSPLTDVVYALNRQYHADITLADNNLESCPLTSTFRNKSLPATLEIIKSTLGIKIRQTPNQIIFEGNCTLK